jgi:hypothetical protein
LSEIELDRNKTWIFVQESFHIDEEKGEFSKVFLRKIFQVNQLTFHDSPSNSCMKIYYRKRRIFFYKCRVTNPWMIKILFIWRNLTKLKSFVLHLLPISSLLFTSFRDFFSSSFLMLFFCLMFVRCLNFHQEFSFLWKQEKLGNIKWSSKEFTLQTMTLLLF